MLRKLMFVFFVLVVAGVDCRLAASDELTCTYELRIEDGFLSDGPWHAQVQVGVGDELSYSLYVVNNTVMFSLIDEENNCVYCGVVRDDGILLTHKWDDISNWTKHHMLTGGLCYFAGKLPTEVAERELTGFVTKYGRWKSIADEVGAIFPELTNVEIHRGFLNLDSETVGYSLHELQDAVVAQLSHIDEVFERPIDSRPERFTISEYASHSFLWHDSERFDTYYICLDAEFECQISAIADRNCYSFSLVSRSDAMVYKGSISNGEAHLEERIARGERDPLESFWSFDGGPCRTTEERRLGVIDHICSRNAVALDFWLEADDQGRTGGRWMPVITSVALDHGPFEWNDADLPASIREIYEMVKDQEPPATPNPEDRPWWLKILTSI